MFYTKYKKKSFKYTKQFYKYGTRKLRVDRNAFAHGSARRKISAKSHVTNKCPVIHPTQQRVALLSQFKAARTIFFSPQNLYLMPANRVWILWKAKKATNWP